MNRFFADTMLGQEREDSAAVKSQRLAERAVLSEFANAEQILAAAKELGITAEKFFSSDGASLKDFACAMGYSRAYLSRLIAKETGASFSQIYSDYRLKFAAELLSDGDLSVENVAAEAGYAGLSGFYKQFYAYYGMTPAEYRKMFE